MTHSLQKAAIIGAGPAGLIAAEILASADVAVTVYERKPSPARKFLLAGRGGLNLTHSEDLSRFMARYRTAAPHLQAAIDVFPPAALRQWAADLGEPTFVGSSGRVFPESFKASPLLRAWLQRLDGRGVVFRFQHRWGGWDEKGALLFEDISGVAQRVTSAATLLALGGASWPQLGSDGGWVDILAARGIAIAPLRPANCGFLSPWSDIFRARFAGQPLKSVEASFAGERVRGEIMLTETGIEGGAIYALAAPLRDAIARDGQAVLHLDLRPDISLATLMQRLQSPRGRQSLSSALRKHGGLAPAAAGLLREVAGADMSQWPAPHLASVIKALPVTLVAPAGIERAISTAGGIPFMALDERFMIKDLPGVFAAGEMLDWEAPTGGYLLQACFSTGVAAARGMLAWFNENSA